MMDQDRRSDERAQLPLQVRWLNTSEVYTTRYSDISLGGCYFDLDTPVQVGQRISFVIQLPSERGLWLHGEVVHQRQNSGFGIRFTDIHKCESGVEMTDKQAALVEFSCDGKSTDSALSA